MAATQAGPPIAGAYMCVNVDVEANATTNTAKNAIVKLPAGMTAQILGVSARARTVASDPAIEIGNTTTVNLYAQAQNLTTATQLLTLNGSGVVSGRGPVAASGNIKVTVTNDTNDTVGFVNVALWMYVEQHATNIPSD